MAKSRRALWLIVPVAAVVATFMAPQEDEFEFLKDGQPLPPQGSVGAPANAPLGGPLSNDHERAWIFPAGEDDVLPRLHRELTFKRGWALAHASSKTTKNQGGQSTFTETRQTFMDRDTETTVEYEGYGRGTERTLCMVVVRERPNVWGRIKRLFRRMVAR